MAAGGKRSRSVMMLLCPDRCRRICTAAVQVRVHLGYLVCADLSVKACRRLHSRRRRLNPAHLDLAERAPCVERVCEDAANLLDGHLLLGAGVNGRADDAIGCRWTAAGCG